jgi:hypothetical protein
MNAPVQKEQAGGTVRTLAVTPAPVSPLDLPVEAFSSGLARRKENRARLMEWVRDALVEGIDFGCIPTRRGASKPSLWKPGAEKICGMLGITVHFPTLHDYEQAALQGVQPVHIIVRCELQDAGGRVVADGVGARSLKQDGGDINKALKMAEKSAHIDATLRMAGLSEVFTQDLEDMTHGTHTDTQTRDTPRARLPGAPGAAPACITPAQREQLEAQIRELGLERQRVKDWLIKATHGRVVRFADLRPDQYAQLGDRLEAWAGAAADTGADHESHDTL